MWDWFFEPFAGETWWDILNSSIVATTLSATVGIILAQRVGQVATESKEAGHAAARARQAIERAEEESIVDVADAEAPANSDAPEQTEAKARFHRAATAIRTLKDYVDVRAERVKDGRVRRKYDNISRRDYRTVITALGDDGGIVGGELKELLEAFERWRSFRTGRQPVSERVAGEYEALANKYKVTSKKPAPWRPERARLIQW